MVEGSSVFCPPDSMQERILAECLPLTRTGPGHDQALCYHLTCFGRPQKAQACTRSCGADERRPGKAQRILFRAASMHPCVSGDLMWRVADCSCASAEEKKPCQGLTPPDSRGKQLAARLAHCCNCCTAAMPKLRLAWHQRQKEERLHLQNSCEDTPS